LRENIVWQGGKHGEDLGTELALRMMGVVVGVKKDFEVPRVHEHYSTSKRGRD